MVFEVLGWVGAIVVLAGYALFSLGRLPNGPLYQVANLVGSICVSINVASHGALPSTIVNVVWAVIAVLVLSRMLRTRRRAARAARDVLVADALLLEQTRLVTLAERASVEASAPSTQPMPLVDAVPVITAAMAVVTLAAMEHAQRAAAEASESVD